MKKLLLTQRSDTPHWVGDGFPVRSIFTYRDLAKQMSPFLLLDYAGPTTFTPSDKVRGVGSHPHRGFETVTIIYSGEVEHRDSSGGGGKIGPGDVQWMTAASGIVHEEFHSRDFSKTGGPFEMIQLWVNLPAKDKKENPRYQTLLNSAIPKVSLKDEAGVLRVIAGTFENHNGPANTYTPINLWDVQLKKGRKVEFKTQKGHTCAVFLLDGKLKFHEGEEIESAELALLDNENELFSLEALEDSKFLILSGEPINEPVIGYGPFVMNSWDEIKKAFEDFESGAMGQIG